VSSLKAIQFKLTAIMSLSIQIASRLLGTPTGRSISVNRFNALLCCPAFNTNLSLLHLAIRTALYYRLGDSSNRSKLNVNGSNFEVQNDTLSAGSGATLIEDVGDQQPDHREFLNYLRDAMRDLKEPRGPRPKRGEGITVGDLT